MKNNDASNIQHRTVGPQPEVLEAEREVPGSGEPGQETGIASPPDNLSRFSPQKKLEVPEQSENNPSQHRGTLDALLHFQSFSIKMRSHKVDDSRGL